MSHAAGVAVRRWRVRPGLKGKSLLEHCESTLQIAPSDWFSIA